MIGKAALELAALTAMPITCNRPAAAVISSGNVVTYDMRLLLYCERWVDVFRLVWTN